MTKRTLLILAAVAASFPAAAIPLPEYDPVLACKGVTSSGPGYNRKICVQGYEDAKAIAAAEWPKVPARIQEACAKAASTTAPWGGSYFWLKDCLQKNGFAKD